MAEATQRRARVLVVDDDPGLRRTLQRMLQTDHDVTLLDSAHEALERCVGGETFDLILCDLMMPAMSGMALFDALQARQPRQADRMAFVTGGAFDDEARAFLDGMPGRSLEKPFTVAMVRDFVDQQLAES